MAICVPMPRASDQSTELIVTKLMHIGARCQRVGSQRDHEQVDGHLRDLIGNRLSCRGQANLQDGAERCAQLAPRAAEREAHAQAQVHDRDREQHAEQERGHRCACDEPDAGFEPEDALEQRVVEADVGHVGGDRFDHHPACLAASSSACCRRRAGRPSAPGSPLETAR